MITNRAYLLMVRTLSILLVVLLLVTSCNPVNDDPPYRPAKSKTVLLYLAANNNLSQDAFANIAEIERGYLPDKGGDNLIIYAHTAGTSPKLLKVYRGEDGKAVRDTVYRFPATNSATAAALTNAINITTTMFPADENGLVLWSHATGWLPSGYYALGQFPPGAKVFGLESDSDYSSPWEAYPGGIDPYANMVKSFGADNGKEIEITNLVKALPHKFTFIIFDACFMGGIEAAYELKDSTDYILFSPTEVLASGYNYSTMMDYLFKSPTDLRGMAESVYNYYNAQQGDYKSVTISLVKTSELNAVADAAKTVFDKYKHKIEALDVSAVQPYFRSNKYWFYDLNDFILQLAGREGAADAAAFKAALERAVIYKAATARFIDIRIDPARFSGISTYIPFHPRNTQLIDFYKTYRWEGFVKMASE